MFYGFISIKISQGNKTLCHLNLSYLSTSTLLYYNLFVAIDCNKLMQQLIQLNHLVKILEFVIKSHQKLDVP